MATRYESPISSSVEPNYTRIGRRIRELRIQRYLSSDELAGKTRLNPGYILRLEKGLEVPEYDTLQLLAKALAVPLYRLFSTGEEPLSTPRLTPRPTLDELVVEGCARSTASSILGAVCEMIVTRIKGLHRVLPSFTRQRPRKEPL